jgi:putative ABC transport system permease protein
VRRPPRLAQTLLRALSPHEYKDEVAGDLDEIWSRGRTSRARYWRLAAASLAALWLHQGSHTPPRRTDETRGDGLMSTLVQDLQFGLRQMRRAPGFTLAAVLTLALGIGVNAATFSIVNVLSFKELPYAAPERVAFVMGWDAPRRDTRMNLPRADFADIAAQSRAFQMVASYDYWSANLTGSESPERVQAYRVTGNTFDLLGVRPLIGRVLTAGDAAPAAPDVAVIGYGLWQRRFGGNPSIVGQTVLLDGRGHTVVGVMPRRFEFPVFNFKGDLWSPIKADAASATPLSSVVGIARLREGVSYREAEAEVATILRRIEAAHPERHHGLGARVVPMRDLSKDTIRPLTLVLMAAVGFVLLLACANVAGLILGRAVTRERELAIRSALGARRGRLVRQLLTETLLLSAAGTALALVFAYAALRALRGSLPELLLVTQPNILDLGVDAETIACSAALAVVSAVLCGVAPAFRTARADLPSSLKQGAQATGGRGQQRLRSTLMVAEVALALVLLVAAGLLVRTFRGLQQVDVGFSPDHVTTLTVTLPEYRYGDAGGRRPFFEQAAEAVQRVPGVESAGFVNVLPFSTYNRGTRYVVEGAPLAARGEEPGTDFRVVTPGYLRALQIPVLRGRGFEDRDRADSPAVALVNTQLARQAFGTEDAVGRRLRLGRLDEAASWLTVVGVIGDVRHLEVTSAPRPEVYVPLAQEDVSMMMLAARTSDEAGDVTAMLQAAIARVDPSRPVYHVKTMTRLLDDALLEHASAMSTMTVFAGLALLLAAVGIYGVVSYAVGQQMREFGIRRALGATPADVLRLVLRRSGSLVSAGIAIGLLGAFALTRMMQALLFGVASSDLPTYAAVAAILFAVGALACYLPARRAMRADPAATLRAE